MDVLIYAGFAVLTVAVGGGIIGAGLALVWLACAILAWERCNETL